MTLTAKAETLTQTVKVGDLFDCHSGATYRVTESNERGCYLGQEFYTWQELERYIRVKALTPKKK